MVLKDKLRRGYYTMFAQTLNGTLLFGLFP